MGSSFSIAIRFRVRERRSSARLKAGRDLWALGFWLWASRRSQGRWSVKTWNPSSGAPSRDGFRTSAASCARQHPCRVGPGSGLPRSIGAPSVPTLTSPHSPSFEDAPPLNPAGEPTKPRASSASPFEETPGASKMPRLVSSKRRVPRAPDEPFRIPPRTWPSFRLARPATRLTQAPCGDRRAIRVSRRWTSPSPAVSSPRSLVAEHFCSSRLPR